MQVPLQNAGAECLPQEPSALASWWTWYPLPWGLHSQRQTDKTQVNKYHDVIIDYDMFSEGNCVVKEDSLEPRRNLDTGTRQDHSDVTLD